MYSENQQGVMIPVHLMLLALVWFGKISRLMGALLVRIYLAYFMVVVGSSGGRQLDQESFAPLPRE